MGEVQLAKLYGVIDEYHFSLFVNKFESAIVLGSMDDIESIACEVVSWLARGGLVVDNNMVYQRTDCGGIIVKQAIELLPLRFVGVECVLAQKVGSEFNLGK